MSWRITYSDSREDVGSDVIGARPRLETFYDVLDHLAREYDYFDWHNAPSGVAGDRPLYNFAITVADDVTVAFVYYD